MRLWLPLCADALMAALMLLWLPLCPYALMAARLPLWLRIWPPFCPCGCPYGRPRSLSARKLKRRPRRLYAANARRSGGTRERRGRRRNAARAPRSGGKPKRQPLRRHAGRARLSRLKRKSLEAQKLVVEGVGLYFQRAGFRKSSRNLV